MSEALERMNIPEVSVDAFTKLLGALYTGAVRSGCAFRDIPTPFLWGPAGVGKSEGVQQIAERLRSETGRRVNVNTVHLLLFSPVDLRGVPVADEHRRFTDWLKPRIFDMDPDPSVINILFLDELSAAPQSVQAAAYQLTLDRRIGEHSLPENCIVIAAGNRTTDQSVAYKMPKALCNRLMHYSVRSDLSSWRSWAIAHSIDSRIVGYLSFDPSRLCVVPESSELAYPTPRSWSFVSNILKLSAGENVRESHELICGCIGVDTAVSFEEWCCVYDRLPSVDDILRGRCQIIPRRNDELYALVSGLVRAVLDKGGSIGLTELENASVYASRLPKDFAMSFFKDISSNGELSRKLMKCRSFSEWMTRARVRF